MIRLQLSRWSRALRTVAVPRPRDYFVRRHDGTLRTLVLRCESLFKPRPLGPLVSMADRLPPSLPQVLYRVSSQLLNCVVVYLLASSI